MAIAFFQYKTWYWYLLHGGSNSGVEPLISVLPIIPKVDITWREGKEVNCKRTAPFDGIIHWRIKRKSNSMGVGQWGRIRRNYSAPYHSYVKAGLSTVTLTVRIANGSRKDRQEELQQIPHAEWGRNNLPLNKYLFFTIGSDCEMPDTL
jgi:hypothetical protein